MKLLCNVFKLVFCTLMLVSSVHAQTLQSVCAACRKGNPALLSKKLRERCAKGSPLAFTRLHSGPWWPQDPRYPNWDYYFHFKEPRPDMGYGITPK